MPEKTERNVLLSLRDVEVGFNVRGRSLTAIRGVSLDIHDGESIAIVGESGSGKTVLTKTFAGMLDSNGTIRKGSILLHDEELSRVELVVGPEEEKRLERIRGLLDRASVTERGAEETRLIESLKARISEKTGLSPEERADLETRRKEISDRLTEERNLLLTLDRREAADRVREEKDRVRALEDGLKGLIREERALAARKRKAYAADRAAARRDREEIRRLRALRKRKIGTEDVPGAPYGLKDRVRERNGELAKEILLSVSRFSEGTQRTLIRRLLKAFRREMARGTDLFDEAERNRIFGTVGYRVRLTAFDPDTRRMTGHALIDCARIRYARDWQRIRGRRIATVFQDPMTSLNPILTIGKQMTMVIRKHQRCSPAEAKKRAIELMEKVGIPDAEKRFDDYPFMYSGGMRQRIVIAIALSCRPKILICDEPTTALDVTIQAQILELIRQLQKDLGFTVVYITHDLGVVANVAERVAVMYAGQIVEIGTAEEIFFEPKHPYTWALLSSLPQLAVKGEEMFSIAGTPPSLYNEIRGDAFAPRNRYAMAVDLEKEPPMFRVSDTHWAKTWLLDPRAPKVEPPENIRNLHEKMLAGYVDYSVEAD